MFEFHSKKRICSALVLFPVILILIKIAGELVVDGDRIKVVMFKISS